MWNNVHQCVKCNIVHSFTVIESTSKITFNSYVLQKKYVQTIRELKMSCNVLTIQQCLFWFYHPCIRKEKSRVHVFSLHGKRLTQNIILVAIFPRIIIFCSIVAIVLICIDF